MSRRLKQAVLVFVVVFAAAQLVRPELTRISVFAQPVPLLRYVSTYGYRQLYLS